MKRQLLDVLVCPVCKGKLELGIEEENETEIVSGSLYCSCCNINYLIKDTIPDMLPPATND